MDDTQSSPSHHDDSQSTEAEDEPRSKTGDQEKPSEPLYRKMATFVVTLVDMLIGWLNNNSEDYRYVVERVRGRDGSGEGAGPSPRATEPSQPWDDVSTQGDKIVQKGDVIVEALHLEPSTEEKEEARVVERELIGEAEKRANKIRQLLVALYYCFLAHSEFVVYFLIILNVLLNGSVLSLVYAFLMFSWGLLSFPWPTRKFWIVLTFYTMFVILIRYAFQFKNADTKDSCLDKYVDQGRCPTQIVGIHYYGRDFYSHVVWDFILLMAVFVHTALLKVGHCCRTGLCVFVCCVHMCVCLCVCLCVCACVCVLCVCALCVCLCLSDGGSIFVPCIGVWAMDSDCK